MFPPNFIRPSEVDTILFPCKAPGTPQEACLKPRGRKLNAHTGRLNFLLAIGIAVCPFLALGEPGSRPEVFRTSKPYIKTLVNHSKEQQNMHL